MVLRALKFSGLTSCWMHRSVDDLVDPDKVALSVYNTENSSFIRIFSEFHPNRCSSTRPIIIRIKAECSVFYTEKYAPYIYIYCRERWYISQ